MMFCMEHVIKRGSNVHRGCSSSTSQKPFSNFSTCSKSLKQGSRCNLVLTTLHAADTQQMLMCRRYTQQHQAPATPLQHTPVP